MAIAYIGLGSNLADPAQQIQNAVYALSKIEQTEIASVSSLYFSRPMGPQDQPDYMNAVTALDTELAPLALLDALQAIENDAGRIRKDNRWGPRILDLDILLFDNLVIDNERLTVPHYGMKEREFVLLPLAEVAPKLTLPDGECVAVLSENIATNGLKVYGSLRTKESVTTVETVS
ncbi:MAG: 2-amino-4-hydroxy-6-hydroxymethyldihydropteridine diphosphokinase [Colwelliaceae bacterium]|nr:2-amino-4-hydroxy-6-hydroxymethyldihydropteridine diphosphokinase [Colwelliaceae bacterium]|tara:strand:- start:62 stop:589 length:528 start_codon:yes stop_codon:yes gene_type:complete